jgi:hypothetical protein
VERKVAQLHGSGLSTTHLRLGAQAVLAQDLPLRDAPVLREARRFAEMASPEVAAVWGDATGRIRAAIPDTTYAIWFAPVSLLGGEAPVLHLLAPEGISTWLERKYIPLIREALKGTGSGYTDVEFVSAGEGTTCR